MKPRLSTLLLLFLLATTSLSVPLREATRRFKPLSSKDLLKGAIDTAIETMLENLFDKLRKQNDSPQFPNRPLMKIEGLSWIKRYFYPLGHYPNFSHPLFTDYYTNDLILATKNYQKYFNLQVTGQLDEVTRQHISMQRCGVPDTNYDFRYNAITTNNNLSWPKGRFPGGKRNLTYGFEPESVIPRDVMDVLRRAFQRWSQAITALNLTEATTFNDADIKVGFYQINREFQKLVVGDAVMLKPGLGNGVVGEIRLDFNKTWALPSFNGAMPWPFGLIDLETVAMHQIGLVLGLDHSPNVNAVMYPSILASRPRNVMLAHDDVQRLQELYVNANAGSDSFDWSFLTLLSFALGFMVFMYQLSR